MTLDDFKGRHAQFAIMAHDLKTDEYYDAIPEKAIADIASEYSVSNEAALAMLDLNGPSIQCPGKHCEFFVEQIAS